MAGRPEPSESGSDDGRTTGVLGGTNAIGSSLTAAVAVALFAWGGMKLDQRWDTQPWMLLLGASLGGLGGFIYMLKELAPDMLPWGSGAESDTRSGDSNPGGANPGDKEDE